MKNKRGAGIPWSWIIGLLIVGYLIYTSGILTPQPQPQPNGGAELPSDLKVDVLLSFKDAKATTETTVNAKWYAFDKDGKYYDSGTAGGTTAGQATFEAAVNSRYTVVAYLDTAAGEYLPETTEITTTNKDKTETIKLTASSGLLIQSMTNTVDLDENLTGAAGSSEEVRIIFTANHTNSGVLPGIYLNTNDTTVVDSIESSKKDSAGGSWKSITCPDRLTPTAATDKIWCFERDSRVYSANGNVIAYWTLTYDSTNTPGNADTIVSRMMDKFMYLKPGYETLDGVLYDYENSADSDIGEADSDSKTSAYSD